MGGEMVHQVGEEDWKVADRLLGGLWKRVEKRGPELTYGVYVASFTSHVLCDV